MSPTLPPFDYNLNSHVHGGTWGSREDGYRAVSLTGGKVETWDVRNSWFLKILLLTPLKTAIGDVDTLPPYENKN